MKAVINMAQPRRAFLKQTTMAAALAISPFASRAQQRDDAEPAASAASSAVITTFDDVWRTVRDRFYDPQLHGLDWSAVRERYLPDAAKAASDEALATVINRMLARLQASHTHYYTPDEPEYYQVPDIFAAALRRRGLERAFPGGRVSYPSIGRITECMDFCGATAARMTDRLRVLPPFSASGAAVSFDQCRIQGQLHRILSKLGKRLEELAPSATLGPAIEAIVDRRVRAIAWDRSSLGANTASAPSTAGRSAKTGPTPFSLRESQPLRESQISNQVQSLAHRAAPSATLVEESLFRSRISMILKQVHRTAWLSAASLRLLVPGTPSRVAGVALEPRLTAYRYRSCQSGCHHSTNSNSDSTRCRPSCHPGRILRPCGIHRDTGASCRRCAIDWCCGVAQRADGVM